MSRRCKQQAIGGINIFVFVLLLLFLGLRGFIYSDWVSYYPAFETFPTINTVEWKYFLSWTERSGSDWEPGFRLYMLLLKSMGIDYFAWNFLSVFIDLCIVGYLFKRDARYFALAFTVFYIYEGITLEVNLMRNAKSIMFFLLSIRYLETKRFLPYLLLNLLGVSFHVSSLVYIPSYYVLTKRISRKVYWGIFIVGNVIYLLKIPFASVLLPYVIDMLSGGRAVSQLSFYFEGGAPSGITIGCLERFFVFILFMLNYGRFMKDGRMYIYLNMYLLYFFFFFYLTDYYTIAQRLSVLFIPSYWFLIPAVYLYLKTKRMKLCFLVLLFLYGVMKLVSANNTIYSRYDNLLFGIESYASRIYVFNSYLNKIFNN